MFLKSLRSSVCDGRRLVRKCGCILSCAHCSPPQEVPKIQLSGPSIPVQSSAIRSVSVQQHIVSVSLESPGQDQDSCMLTANSQDPQIVSVSTGLVKSSSSPRIRQSSGRCFVQGSAASGGIETSPGGSTADLTAVWKSRG